MRKIGFAFTVIVACMVMLWAGTVEAQGKRQGPPFDPRSASGGLPLCQANLNTCNADLGALKPLSGAPADIAESLRGFVAEGASNIQIHLDPTTPENIEKLAPVLEAFDSG